MPQGTHRARPPGGWRKPLGGLGSRSSPLALARELVPGHRRSSRALPGKQELTPGSGAREQRLAWVVGACRRLEGSGHRSQSPGGRILRPERLYRNQRGPGFAALFVGVLLKRFC